MKTVVIVIVLVLVIMGSFLLIANILANDPEEIEVSEEKKPVSGSVRGFVRYGLGKGHPLEGVEVKFGELSMTTGIDGYYSFNNLAETEDRLYFFKEDYYHLPEDVKVYGDTVIVNISMTSEKYVRDISGFIRNFDNSIPVSEAEIILESEKAVTDDEGRFELSGIPFSAYRVIVKHKDFHSYDTTGVVINNKYVPVTCYVKPGKPVIKWIKARTYQLKEENYHWTLDIKTKVFDHVGIKYVFCTGVFVGNNEDYKLYCEPEENGVYALLYKGSRRYKPQWLHVVDDEDFETVEEIFYED